MVTAELAMGLPALVFVLLFGLTMLGALATEARCADAARIGARAAARGETDEAVRRWAALAAPPGAIITLRRGTNTVEIQVRAGFVGGGRSPLPAIGVEATAISPVEYDSARADTDVEEGNGR
jgi:hypothetical protein